MNTRSLIAICCVILGLACDAQRVGALSQAHGYLVKLRELLNDQLELEAGGSSRKAEDDLDGQLRLKK